MILSALLFLPFLQKIFEKVNESKNILVFMFVSLVCFCYIKSILNSIISWITYKENDNSEQAIKLN
jgi:riboflavin transporter FmnP